MTEPTTPDHEWHIVAVGNRFGHGMEGRVQIRRQGKALFVRRDETGAEVRIMDLGGNPPLVCVICGKDV